MGKIKTFYFVNHSHTDIGFTDYQDVAYRQHMEFIDRALDLCEATADYPKEAQAKWVCEVTGMTERWLHSRPSKQVERFVKLNKAGLIDVAGMQYNLTPLLNVEQMIRSLYPVKRIKDEFGIDIKVAMNCDVNGASWMFVDLLVALGVELFTMAVNPIRGGTPKPRPSAFWWEGPAGGKILAWNGYHYLFGGFACLGHMKLAEQHVPRIVKKLEDDPHYPFDFVFGQATNPTRVDNGPPDTNLYDFVRDWNAAGKTPKMELITVSDFNRILRRGYGKKLPTMRGDWLDWWSDGVASSAFETGLNRGTHEVLYSAEMIGAWNAALGQKGWPAQLLDHTYESATLYDEHTWGAFSSIEAPDGLFSRSQWNKKSGYAYHASAEAHDILARTARGFATRLATQEDEVRFDLAHLPPEIAKPEPTYTELLVINTLAHEREVVVEEPIRRGGQAPNGMLEMFMPRGLTWGIQPDPVGARVAGSVPGLGYSWIPLSSKPGNSDLKGAANSVENSHYRIKIDPRGGGLLEFYDKEQGHDFAGEYRGWKTGQFVYEWVDSPEGRNAIFAIDWFNEDFGAWPGNTPFRYETPHKVTVSKPQITPHQASISVTIQGRGLRSATCTYSLLANRKQLEVSWMLDKEHVTDPEAVFIPFAFNLEKALFRADINGIPLTPDQEQLPGTVRDWYPLQRWVDIHDGKRGVTIVPMDAPLVHLGGITAGKWLQTLKPEAPVVMSWALNNHWMVNFKASQGGHIPLRYKLTTHAGAADDAACARFGVEAVTPPIVLRDFIRRKNAPQEGRFMEVSPNDFLVTAKPAEDGKGIIVRIQNVSEKAASCSLRFPELKPKSAHLTSPSEETGKEVTFKAGKLSVRVPGRAVVSLRVRF